MAEQHFRDIAQRLVDNGYLPLPIWWGQKRPAVKEDWPHYRFQPADLAKYGDAGTGIICGDVVGLDIDLLREKLAKEFTALAVGRFGPAPARVGKAPKVLLMFRAEEPFGKIQTPMYRFPDDPPISKAFTGHKVEILADGQQFVSFNKHPVTGLPYLWGDRSPLNVRRADLPLLTRAQAIEFVAECERLMIAAGAEKVGRLTAVDAARDHKPNEKLLAEDPDECRAALAACPNEEEEYDDWVRMMYAVKGALGEEGIEDFLRWSRKSPEKHREKETIDYWRRTKPSTIGAGTIYYWAEKLSGWVRPPFIYSAIPDEWLKVAPPAMTYTMEPLLPSETVALLIAEGGAGKTTFAMRVALAVASGRELFGMRVKQGRVLYIALEDRGKSLRRRLWRLVQNEMERMRRDGSSVAELDKFVADVTANFLLVPGAGKEFHIIKTEKGNIVQDDTLQRFIDTLPLPLELLVMDPMARLHGANENDNSVGTAIINAMERIVSKSGCCALIPHHTGKASARESDATQHAARGASSLVDGARSSIRLLVVTEKGELDVPDEVIAAGDLVQVVHNKSNEGPKGKPFYLRRQELDYELYTPRMTSVAEQAAIIVGGLWRWFCQNERHPFDKQTITDKVTMPEIVGKNRFSRDSMRSLYDRLVERGELIATGKFRDRSKTPMMVFRAGFEPPQEAL